MAFVIAVAVAIAVIALLMAVPVDIDFDAAWPDAGANRVSAHWGFGVLRFRLDRANDESGASAASRAPAGRPPGAKGGSARLLEALRGRPFRRRLLRFARSLWRAVQKRGVEVSIRAGTGDPAETGWLWGVLGPLSAWLQTLPDCRVTLKPDFVEASVRVHGRGRLTIVPLQILVLVCGLLVSPAIWRGMAGRHA